MNRLQLALILVPAAAIACFGCRPEQTRAPRTLSLAIQPCDQRTEYRSELNILLLDRTTRLSQQDLERWQRGLTSLLNLDDVAGRVELLDLVAVGELVASPEPICYPASLKKRAQPEQRKGIAHQASTLFSKWRYGAPETEAPSTELVAEINGARKKVRDALVGVPMTQPIAATRSTDIERPVREAISKRCQRVQTCRLLMFTDLIDTTIAQKISTLDASRSGELGAEYANEMMRTTANWTSAVAIQVVVWGFGRGENGAGISLPPETQRKLEAFWTAYFSAICKRVAGGSGVSISLEAPQSLPDACP